MNDLRLLSEAISTLKRGGVIAYPTEAVFGLGCDPWCPEAVSKINQLKSRAQDQGYILIAADLKQASPLIDRQHATDRQIQQLELVTSPAITWIFPASDQVPPEICGPHKTIALRLTRHPVAQQLCMLFGKPLVSTSANYHGETPAITTDQVATQLGDKIDYIVSGEVGDQTQPSEIRHAITGKVLRPSTQEQGK